MLKFKIQKGDMFYRALYTVLLSLFCAVALVFGMTLKQESVSADVQTKEVAITGVEIRAEVSSAQYYFVLKTNEYGEVPVNTLVENTENYATLLSNVTLYTSETDETGILASSVCKADGWKLNLWGSAGIMFPMSAEDYEMYSGSSVYKVSVAKGTVLPCLDMDLIVIEDITFTNDSYGNEANKYSSFFWTKLAVFTSMEVAITGVQLRADPASDLYYLVLLTNEHAQVSVGLTVSNPDYYAELLSQVMIYMSETDKTGISAADVCEMDGWVLNRWGSGGLMLPMTAENYERYNGTTVYKVSVKAGAILPCGNAELTVIEDVAYTNDGYGEEASKYEAFIWSVYLGDISTVVAELTGVQLRAAPESGIYYFVITSEQYAGVPFGESVPSLPRYNELLSKVRLYTSEEDEVGVLAAEICNSSNWVMNLWDSHGVMFPMTAENYEKYNGTTVYKIVIEGNTVIPCYGVDLWVDADSVYLNTTYGNEEMKNSGFYWSYIPSKIVNFGECTLTDINNRSNDLTDTRWLFLFFTETFEARQDVSGWIKQLNTLDYIEFYPTDDLTQPPISLRDVYRGNTIIKQFDQNTAMTFTIEDEYSGANMYMLVVKAGCQIPYIKNGEYGYRVVTSGKSFINDKYGETGDIFGLYDEMGMPRTYENWGIWWTAASRVSFQVKGLDNVSYPTLILPAGDVIDLRDYAVEGYKVSLSTAEGDRCIGGYIVPDEGAQLVLTYTVDDGKDEKKENGCQSAVGMNLMPLSIVVAAVLLKKKREGANDENV